MHRSNYRNYCEILKGNIRLLLIFPSDSYSYLNRYLSIHDTKFENKCNRFKKYSYFFNL